MTVDSRVEAERARVLSYLCQPTNSAPTMVMCLDQPLTVGAPTDAVEPFKPVGQPVTPEQSGEHAAEQTPKAALEEPIDGLTIDTDTVTLVLSPRRRSPVSDGTPASEVSSRSRHKSA